MAKKKAAKVDNDVVCSNYINEAIDTFEELASVKLHDEVKAKLYASMEMLCESITCDCCPPKEEEVIPFTPEPDDIEVTD